MFHEEITTKNGVVKQVIGQTQEELAEAVKAVKNEELSVAPNIHDPRDGNKVVSPDNRHTESSYVQPEEVETAPTAETQGAEKEIERVKNPSPEEASQISTGDTKKAVAPTKKKKK